MPQMSPMPWIIILTYTLLTLTFMNSYIYFYQNKNVKSMKKYYTLTYKMTW